MKKLMSFAAALFAASTAARAEVDDFGRDLIGASERILSIVSAVDDETPVNPDQPSVPIDDVWRLENDALAVPRYLAATKSFGDAGQSFIQSRVAEVRGDFAEATLRKTQSCARVSIALNDLAVANLYASQPGFSMKLAPFGPELTELLRSIRYKINIYCIF